MMNKLAAVAVAATIASGASAQENYVGQILLFGTNYCPTGTIAASGQILPINQNTELYSLFGTTYGGDGQTTFGLPDLRTKDANGQPIGPGLPGAGMLHCVVERGYYPPRD